MSEMMAKAEMDVEAAGMERVASVYLRNDPATVMMTAVYDAIRVGDIEKAKKVRSGIGSENIVVALAEAIVEAMSAPEETDEMKAQRRSALLAACAIGSHVVGARDRTILKRERPL